MAAKRGSAPPPQVKPIYSLSISQWREDAPLQAKLRAILDDPTFQLAQQTLLNAAMPGTEPAAKAEPGVAADAMNTALAHRYVHRSGFGYSFRMLRFLTSASTTTKPSTPYGDLQEEDE